MEIDRGRGEEKKRGRVKGDKRREGVGRVGWGGGGSSNSGGKDEEKLSKGRNESG